MAKGNLKMQVLGFLMVANEFRERKGTVRMKDLMQHMQEYHRYRFYRILKVLEEFEYVRKEGKKWIANKKLRRILSIE